MPSPPNIDRQWAESFVLVYKPKTEGKQLSPYYLHSSTFEILLLQSKVGSCVETITNRRKTEKVYFIRLNNAIVLFILQETIDVAYSMYTYTAEFLKISPARRISGVGQKEGIYRFITPTVKDVPIKEINHESKTAYLEDLAQNWLMTKALTNFARHGTIQEVSFIDCADNTII